MHEDDVGMWLSCIWFF